MTFPSAVPSIERALREENDFLRERVRQLEDLLKPRHSEDMVRVYASALGVSPAEARLLNLMSRREHVNREQYQAACCTEESDGEKLLSVRICHLRRRLKGLGIEIGTTWGHGYYMPASSKKQLQATVADWIARGRPVTRQFNTKREVPDPCLS